MDYYIMSALMINVINLETQSKVHINLCQNKDSTLLD